MCMAFYKWTPKKGKMEDAKPEDFFVNFHLFCDDYKNIWKKEQASDWVIVARIFDVKFHNIF